MLQTGGGIGFWRERFLADHERRYRAARRSQRSLFLISLARIVQSLTTAVLLLGGGWLAARGSISVGTVVVFILATRQLFDSATQASNLVGQVQISLVGLARLLDLLTATAPAPGSTPPGPHPTTPDRPPSPPNAATWRSRTSATPTSRAPKSSADSPYGWRRARGRTRRPHRIRQDHPRQTHDRPLRPGQRHRPLRRPRLATLAPTNCAAGSS